MGTAILIQHKVLHQFKDHEVKYAPYALAANDTEETVFTFSLDQRLTEQRAPEKPQVHLETYHALGDQQGNLYDDKMQYVNYDDKGVVIYATAIDDHYDEYYQRDPTIAPTPLEPFVTFAELRENGTIDPGVDHWNSWVGTKAAIGSVWNTLKLWDNSDVAANFRNLRDEGRGILSSSYLAFAGNVGENIGIGTLTSAYEGRNAAGEQLSIGGRALYAVGGLTETALNVVGLRGAPRAIGGAMRGVRGRLASAVGRFRAWRAADEAAESLVRTIDDDVAGALDELAESADNVVDEAARGFAEPINELLPTRPGGTGAAYDEVAGQGVYILRDASGEIRYVGRGDAPERLLAHAKPGSGKEDLVGEILFNNNLPASKAMSLEQELMQMFGGPKSVNSSTVLRNKIQGIGERNPNFIDLEFAAGDDLVFEALRRAGLLGR